MDEMLKLCVNQGYVPADCIMDGMPVYLLIKDGKNPCCGCNGDCIHKACQYKEMAVDQKEKDKFENIDYEIIENIPVVKEETCGYLICDLIEKIDHFKIIVNNKTRTVEQNSFEFEKIKKS